MTDSPWSNRAFDIDVAKGLAIALVVLGHVVARDIRPAGNDWYTTMNRGLYLFHMAFFFYLSGFVFFLKPLDGWFGRWLKLTRRLAPAYLLFAALVYLAKFGAAYVLPVDRPVGDPVRDISLLILQPTESFASFLWFIVVLLQVQLFAAWLLLAAQSRLWVALAVALGLHLLSLHGYVPKWFALHQVARYLVFFLLAGLVVQYRDFLESRMDKGLIIWVGLFLVSLALVPAPWGVLWVALASIPALHGLARRVGHGLAGRVLVFLGAASLTIYLMNSLALGLVRGVILRTTGWDEWRFFVALPVLWVAGLLLPILVQRQLFSRFVWLDRITR